MSGYWALRWKEGESEKEDRQVTRHCWIYQSGLFRLVNLGGDLCSQIDHIRCDSCISGRPPPAREVPAKALHTQVKALWPIESELEGSPWRLVGEAEEKEEELSDSGTNQTSPSGKTEGGPARCPLGEGGSRRNFSSFCCVFVQTTFCQNRKA